MKLKNYKKFIPIILIVLLAFSIYSTASTNIKTLIEYKNAYNTATDYAKKGIVDDAAAYYQKALSIKNSVDVYIEYADVYAKNGDERKAMRIAEDMLKEFKDSPKAYEYLLKRYIAMNKLEDCFALNDEATKKQLVSDGFKETMSKIEYLYTYDYQQYENVSVYNAGYCSVENDGKCGFVDEVGETVIQNTFSDAGTFAFFGTDKIKNEEEYVAPVCTADGLWMYISSTGNKKVEFNDGQKFDQLGLYIADGLTAARVGEKYAYYDNDFKKVIGDYAYASTFNCKRAAVMTELDNWYIIDEKGKKINSTPYTDVFIDEKGIAYRNDRAFVQVNGKYQMIDLDCKQIGNSTYEEVFNFFDDTYAAVKINDKWGFVDQKGKVVLDAKYKGARSFSNGLAAVFDGSKWGYIDSKGKLVIDYLFNEAKDFNKQGCAFVCEKSRWSLLKLYKYNH